MFFKRAIGIDLGTSYSTLARLDDLGRTAMVRNSYGDLLTPSVVLFEDAELVVGRDAVKSLLADPERVADDAKRDLGQEHYRRPIRGTRLPPEVIAGCILQRLGADAMAAAGSDFEAVLAVPDCFDPLARQAMLAAGRLAGLPGLDLLDDSSAAALALGEQLGFLDAKGCLRHPARVLIYNLGGGTFGVSLVDLAAGSVRTLARDGDPALGARDWDAVLRDFAAAHFQQLYGHDPRQDLRSLLRLDRAAVEARHTLSVRDRAEIRVEHAGLTCDVPIARGQFEELTAHLLDRTSHITRQLFADGRNAWRDVGHVLLVGGATRMPMVAALLRKLSGLEPEPGLNPDEAVARGAAIYAGHRVHKQAPDRPHSRLRVSSDREPPPLGTADSTSWIDQQVAHWQGAVMAGAPFDRFARLAASAPARPAEIAAADQPAESGLQLSYSPSGEALFVPGNLNDAYDLDPSEPPATPDPASPALAMPGMVQPSAASSPPFLPATPASPVADTIPLAPLASGTVPTFAGPTGNPVPQPQPGLVAAAPQHIIGGYPVAGESVPVSYPAGQYSVAGAQAGYEVEHYAVAESAPPQVDVAPEAYGVDSGMDLAAAAADNLDVGDQPAEAADDLDSLAYSESPARRRARRRGADPTARMIVNLVAHLLSSVLGLALGYYILCWISPQSNFLHLQLPLLPPPPAEEQPAHSGTQGRADEPPDEQEPRKNRNTDDR